MVKRSGGAGVTCIWRWIARLMKSSQHMSASIPWERTRYYLSCFPSCKNTCDCSSGYPRNEAVEALKIGELKVEAASKLSPTFTIRNRHVPLQTTEQFKIEHSALQCTISRSNSICESDEISHRLAYTCSSEG